MVVNPQRNTQIATIGLPGIRHNGPVKDRLGGSSGALGEQTLSDRLGPHAAKC